MKVLLFSSILAIVTLSSHSQVTNQDLFTKNLLASKRTALAPENPVNADWLSDAQKNIAEQEYYFKQKLNSSNHSFCVANRQQQVGFNIDAAGYSVYPLQLSNKPLINNWREQFSFLSIKKGNASIAKKGFDVIEDKSKMEFKYNDFSIQYINDKQGLRQNFIIDHKPEGNGNVQVYLQVDGTLSPSVKNNGLQFKNAAGANMLYYRDLHVWDANHRILNATMALNEKNVLAINVDDKDATYPITIDPINQTPEWTTSADGVLPTLIGQLAVDAAYGFSVAGLGDINGDGYDDVAIGAPAMVDLISGTGELASVGAVFVYYGKSTGLSATPGAVLQPTTCVAGALFGFSIAGGDINNDGKADIIVGAPLDNVSISIGGGSTASGTVGKVYAFNGATLTATTSPLLTLQLSGSGILENGVNLSVNALFGFSVAVTEDLNGDGKKDIIVGSPTYAGIKTGLFGNSLLDVQSGGAFVFLSNASDNTHTLVTLQPTQSDILGLGLLQANIGGLLFGYSVDGVGDYNGDGKADVVVGAPAGIDASSLSGLLNGKLLQGSAVVYYGTGSGINANPGATLTATSGGLLTNLTGSIGNIANLFGISVKGVRNIAGTRNGNVLVGAPLGGAIINVLSLKLKAGTVSVFKKKSSSPSGYVAPDQVLASPRNSNSILQLIQCNLLFGFSIDNTLDLNCDGFPDIIVGEPASSGVQLLNANVAGGAAYVYLGKSDGTYQTTPAWTLTATEDAFLGVNATSLIGYSVAGAGHVRGFIQTPRVLVGAPSRTLDFGSGLLNLGSTFGTLFGLVAGDNGVGKAYESNLSLCSSGGPLPVVLNNFNAAKENDYSVLNWATSSELNVKSFTVERSTDNGKTWQAIGDVMSKGNSSSNQNYSFTDNNPENGTNLYRLQIEDDNGSTSYSGTKQVEIESAGSMNVYPNPVGEDEALNIELAGLKPGAYTISMISASGQVVKQMTFPITSSGSATLVIPTGNMARGSYVVSVKGITLQITKTVVVANR